MKKIILFLPCVLTLCACATFGTYGPVGQSFDDVIIEYGVPTSQYTLQNGDIAYSFVKPCTYTQGQEEIVVVVGEDNIVNKVSEVSTCPSATEEKQHNEYVAPQPNYVREKPEKKKEEKPAPVVTPKINPNSPAGEFSEKWENEKKKNQEKLKTLNKELEERKNKESTMEWEIVRFKNDLSLAQQTLEKMRNIPGTDVAGRNEVIKMKKEKIAKAEKELKAFQSETSKLKAEIMVLEMQTK